MATPGRDVQSPVGPRRWADFGGTCLLGEFLPEPDLLLPTSTAFGIPKSASYLYGTWRDESDVMYRAIRGVAASASDFAFAFSTEAGRQLERLDLPMYLGPTTVGRAADAVTFAPAAGAPEADAAGPAFHFRHDGGSTHWEESDLFSLDGRLLGPGLQWYHPWSEGGGCYTATTKYASEGTFLGRRVTGFLGHEIHYMPTGRTWFNTRYGLGMEICWQQIANEYDDGTFVQATFAYGTDGWGFAMVHRADGSFRATTNVEIDAVVRENGSPEQIDYHFDDEHWIWTIDPHGERARTIEGAPLGADGTCRKVGDTRAIVRSMGNSDWWADGRYEASRQRGDAKT